MRIKMLFYTSAVLVFSYLFANKYNKTQDSTLKPFFKDVSETHLKSKSLGANSMDANAIDIDKDGDIDLIIAIEFRKNVILINNGNGVLKDESKTRFPDTAHDSEDMAIADFDKDGDLDIVFVSEDDQTNEFYRNDGNGIFSNDNNIIPVSGISNVVETTDFNNDGYADLIIGNRGQNFLLINNRKGGFINETLVRLPKDNATTQDIELKDIDGDEDLDIVEANETSNRLLINDGNGIFTDESEKRLPTVNDQTREVEVADIDNDGDLDIFYANVDFGGIGNPQNRLLLNNGNGFFSEITTSALPKSNFRTVGGQFFDINNDGFTDIITGNRWNKLDNMVLINNKKNSFIDQTSSFFPKFNVYTFDFQLADFNGDGLTDIYLCNFRGDDILLFRNGN